MASRPSRDAVSPGQHKQRNDSMDRQQQHAIYDSQTSPTGRSNGAETAMSLAARENTNKKANLSLVPCKFYRNGACSAGAACPFAHVDVGTPKQICPWYAQSPSSCKFGAKCQLAHVLPGQPMAYDRKNKRAQILAQREFENLHSSSSPEHTDSPVTNKVTSVQDVIIPPGSAFESREARQAAASGSASQPAASSRRRQTSSGITLALELAANGSSKSAGFIPPPSQPVSAKMTDTTTPLGAWAKGLTDAIRSPVPLPANASSQGQRQVNAPSKQYGFEVTSEQSQMHTQGGAKHVQPILQQGFLPQGQMMPAASPSVSPTEAFRPRETFSSDFFQSSEINEIHQRSSPTRAVVPTTPPMSSSVPYASQFNESPGSQIFRSPSRVSPLPKPHDTVNGTSNAFSMPNTFGTSPFSFPGTKASIFLQPSSFGSDDAPIHQMRSPESSPTRLSSPRKSSFYGEGLGRRSSVPAYTLSELSDDEDTAEGDFLPSSLHDLLEPSEMSRRKNVALLNQAHSQSVPASSYLQNWQTLSSANGNQPSIQSGPFASTSESTQRPTAAKPFDSPPLHNHHALLSHAPGSSLPPGVAAAMSRLHFQKTQHAVTPPSGTGPVLSPSMSGTSPKAASFFPQQRVPSRTAHSSKSGEGMGAPPSRSSALGRRTSSSNSPGTTFATLSGAVGSPLSRTAWLHDDPEDAVTLSSVANASSGLRRTSQSRAAEDDEHLAFAMDL